ncbi:NAD-dependent epimerase/dehydratase family protein [Terriglobus roseus]|uniref:Nucleoside-diphosphate-sugar epimerase n=1 Tax=Terriglobus roseus TaxID=392734 RepID=A0A1G7KZ09_9BACT|nr:NAD(P)-dependent oxidoreductase [Terriglobus roseus]SDF41969.1 Nucleoside-diphosphate-sugar epimerase [Terriglobus roseus]
MRRVIVTGANGFMGLALTRRLLAEGTTVHAFTGRSHDSLEREAPGAEIHSLHGQPLEAAELVRQIEPEAIFHLATVVAEPRDASGLGALLEANISLGASLLQGASQCRKSPVFVNAGSYWQFDADGSRLPNTLYAATKQAFDELLQYYRRKYRIPAATLILYDTFGETDTRQKLWRRLLTSSAGTDFALSPGEQRIHLVHVDDVVDAFVKAASLLHEEKLEGTHYSVHSLHPLPLRELVESLNAAAGLQLNLKWGALPYPADQKFEPYVGEALPGWSPRVDVLDAMVRYGRNAAMLQEEKAR